MVGLWESLLQFLCFSWICRTCLSVLHVLTVSEHRGFQTGCVGAMCPQAWQALLAWLLPYPRVLHPPHALGPPLPPNKGVSLCVPLCWVGLLSIAPSLHIQLLPTVTVGAGLWGIPTFPGEAGQPELSLCSAVTDTVWPYQVTDGGFGAGFISCCGSSWFV